MQRRRGGGKRIEEVFDFRLLLVKFKFKEVDCGNV